MPATQVKHTRSSVALPGWAGSTYWPKAARQVAYGVQLGALLPLEYVPGPHAAQRSDVLLPVMTYLPAGQVAVQVVHDPASLVSLNVPLAQATQRSDVVVPVVIRVPGRHGDVNVVQVEEPAAVLKPPTQSMQEPPAAER